MDSVNSSGNAAADASRPSPRSTQAHRTSTRTMHIVLAYAPQPRQVHECHVDLPVGSTVQQVLQAAAWHQQFAEVGAWLEQAAQSDTAEALACGIWGKKCALNHVLQDGDRLELYRPLLVDPKMARRKRFNAQGSRGAGLFSLNRNRVAGRLDKK